MYFFTATEPYIFDEVNKHNQNEMLNLDDVDILKMRVDATKNTCDIIQRLKKDDDQMSQLTTGI